MPTSNRTLGPKDCRPRFRDHGHPRLIRFNGDTHCRVVTFGTGSSISMLTRKGTAMTSASEIQPPLGLGSGIEALRAKRGWIIALGIIYVIAGLIALGSVVMATVVSVFVVGIMMLIAGVAEVIHAFQVKSWGKFLFWLLLVCCTSLLGLSHSRIRSLPRRS